METLICQSCGLPFTKELMGTNRDKTRSEEYCISCFENGKFIDHSLSLHKLEMKLLEMAEVHEEITLEEAQAVIKKLPYLKRWHMSIM
ncbi:putative zinc ribbon protein [Gillisia mitskevichiae]|uniref:Putative zinc ribbon protein n=1 Tax=Gillisia mitskevichiae TaxID=270921 RepID=A0A495PIG9_9FLAO|nr:zinc ribbon domain-containing protein [Gillisia mitskevichiae]RKS50541.1 putative zinc ribbon protein [Gillisia mitskevichiae]